MERVKTRSRRGRERSDPPVEDGFILTDPAGRAIALDQGAGVILAACLDPLADIEPPGHHHCLPPVILERIAGPGSGGRNGDRFRFRAGSRDYTAVVFHIRCRTSALPEAARLIHFCRDSGSSDALVRVAAEYHLTDREIEAVQGIAMGLTSKEIAFRMKISPATVKAFLRLIMAKMGVPNRASVVSRLLAGSHGPAETASRNESH